MVSLCLVISIFAQQEIRNKEYYLKKSKDEKTVAWMTLSGGIALAITGYMIGSEGDADITGLTQATGGLMFLIGTSSTIVSLFLFGASNNNKEKAGKAIAVFKMERLQGTAMPIATRSIPALGIRISL